MQKFFEEYGDAIVYAVCTILSLAVVGIAFQLLRNSAQIEIKTKIPQINQQLMNQPIPDIQVKNMRITLGTAFDPNAHVKVIDSHDGDISNKVVSFGNVNTQKKGVYKIRYYVENSKGIHARKNVFVIVD